MENEQLRATVTGGGLLKSLIHKKTQRYLPYFAKFLLLEFLNAIQSVCEYYV